MFTTVTLPRTPLNCSLFYSFVRHFEFNTLYTQSQTLVHVSPFPVLATYAADRLLLPFKCLWSGAKTFGRENFEF